jgi:hypothetical protein
MLIVGNSNNYIFSNVNCNIIILPNNNVISPITSSFSEYVKCLNNHLFAPEKCDHLKVYA